MNLQDKFFDSLRVGCAAGRDPGASLLADESPTESRFIDLALSWQSSRWGAYFRSGHGLLLSATLAVPTTRTIESILRIHLAVNRLGAQDFLKKTRIIRHLEAVPIKHSILF